MSWLDLAFLHWPVPHESLRRLVPRELEIETFDDSVRLGDRQGVYFFSLDAASWPAVIGARATTGLRYFHARTGIRREEGRVRYDSVRAHPGAAAAGLACEYHATGPAFTSAPGSFEFWSTERYSLFSQLGGRVLRLDIEHPRWPLQRAEVRIERNTMTAASGISLPATPPHVLFAARQDVVAHWPRSVPFTA
jgi:uncharacterized protein YqjF (DUF2071 family)